MVAAHVTLAVNGKRVDVPADLDPTTSLNDFIRLHTRFTGPKKACGEGGCGSCAVEVETFNPTTGKTSVKSINSCLAPIASLHGCAVTTSEGLGNSTDGFHPIQERIAGFHASQCGFCTPGMVIACHTALAKAKKKGEAVTPEGMEQALDGNLCRCTGYRPILDTCKSFAGEPDIEDFGLRCFKDDKLPIEGGLEPVFPESLKEAVKTSLKSTTMGGRKWAAPASLSELFTVLKEAEQAGDSVRLVSGNTGFGVYKVPFTESLVVSLSHITELRAVQSTEAGLVVGGAVTLEELIEELRDAASDPTAPFQQVAAHVERIAGNHVRSVATVGGNLALTQSSGLPSDLAPLLIAVDAEATVVSPAGTRSLSVEELLLGPALGPQDIIATVSIPTSQPGDVFWSNRIAPRYSNAVAAFNAAIALSIRDGTIVSARIVFGHPGDKKDSWTIARATSVEAALAGAPCSLETLEAALEAAPAAIPAGAPQPEYLLATAEGLLTQALAPLIAQGVQSEDASALLGVQKWGPPGLVGSKQDFPAPRELTNPIGYPIQKDRSILQASGEALYTSDIVLPKGGLYAAFVLSDEALAELGAVDPSAALALPGVHAYFGAKDIPAEGSNEYSHEQIFADGSVVFNGQAIGIVCAETQELAERAARLVKVEYKKTLGEPILTIPQAVKAEAYYDTSVFGPMGVTKTSAGDVEAAMKDAPHVMRGATYKTPSQAHFYLEPQASVAIPDEGNTIEIWSSVQGIDFIQHGLANVLGLPYNKIHAKARRAGGAFGGKCLRAVPPAAAAALAALKLKRAVRLVTNRSDNMRMCGGRVEIEATYDVAYDDNGKILALDMLSHVQAGAFVDIAFFLPFIFQTTLDHCYFIPNIRLEAKLCKTNVPPRTAVRAPGVLQALLFIESVIERVAAATGLDPHAVREANLLQGPVGPPEYRRPCAGETAFGVDEEAYRTPEGDEDEDVGGESVVKTTFGVEINSGFYTVPMLWNSLKAKSEFDSRRKAVEEFNASNLWRKRGLSMLAGRFSMFVNAKPAGIHLYHDGTVGVLTPGHEMGQGILTKAKQAAVFELSKLLPADKRPLPLDLFHVLDNSTYMLPNSGPSFGSTTSESATESVRLAAEKLRKQLQPHFDEMGAEASWLEVCKKIHPMPGFSASKVLMSAFNFYDGSRRSGPAGRPLTYSGYGVGSTEVEIDVLTGEKRVLRADVMLDASYSLNPGIDIGQVEGGYVQGLGLVLGEEVRHEPGSGRLANDGTWTYKVPAASDIPRQLNAYLLRDAPNPRCIMSSKAVGEPPLLIAVSALNALQAAVRAAKQEVGKEAGGKSGKEAVLLGLPVTAERIKAAIGPLPIVSMLKGQ